MTAPAHSPTSPSHNALAFQRSRRSWSVAAAHQFAPSKLSHRGFRSSAHGSCWSEVIARLQAAGLNVTAVQNPLTTLPEAVASAQRVLARQDGPTVLAGHSFSGMIVTDAGVHPNVSAMVYVAARAPDADEDYT